MRLLGPVRAHGTCLGRSPLSSPTRSPGSRCEAGAPAPEPAEKFRRCKREKMQLSRTPAPPSRGPTPAARPLVVATLATPDAPEKWRRGRHPGFPGGYRRRPRATATFPFAVSHQGRRTQPPPARPLRPHLPVSPAPARPSAPPCSPARQGAPLTPPCGGRGSGRAGYIGWNAPLRPARPSLSGDFFISLPNSRRFSLLSLFYPPPPPLLLSCLSRLFFPG